MDFGGKKQGEKIENMGEKNMVDSENQVKFEDESRRAEKTMFPGFFCLLPVENGKL